MSEFTTGKVVLLFTGAAVVSVLLICLLNAEANNRRVNREPQIAEGNMFSVIGKHVKHVVKRWVDNDDRPQSSNATDATGASRTLKSLVEPEFEPAVEQQVEQQVEPQVEPQQVEPHVRHGRHRHSDDATTTKDSKSATVDPSVDAATGSSEQCFTTRQVLMVITVTCAVNFAFVLLVISCVRIFNPATLDATALPNSAVQSASRLCRHSDASYNSVQEYVDSLLPSPETSMWSLNSLQRLSSFRRPERGSSASMEELLFV